MQLPKYISYTVSFAAVFILTYLIVSLTGALIHRIIGVSIFGPLNFIGGGLLGLIKGVVAAYVIVLVIMSLPLPKPLVHQFKTSSLVQWSLPTMEKGYRLVLNVAPKKVPYISDFFKKQIK
jgi:uncharacterized membrane protein required for colicin V production